MATKPTEKLSLEAARRIAVSAQGFGVGPTKADKPVIRTADPAASAGPVEVRRARGLVNRLGVIQIDSVNVLVRSQELPVLARLGPHARDVLPELLDQRHVFEYWAHEASLVPVELQPSLRWRMDDRPKTGLLRFAEANSGYIEAILAEVADCGPVKAGELTDPGERGGPWWGWNKGKRALEYLFLCGQVMARRTNTFERVYDLTERVLPAAILALPTPEKGDAQRALVERAARAMGISTIADLADYYRMPRSDTAARVEELVAQGVLSVAAVPGWRERAFVHAIAARPRTVHASALLSPFDSLVWNRNRTERIFDFRYRIELYTPQPKRQYGYYVLPFLYGDRLVARVDVKADRHRGVLRTIAVHGETSPGPTLTVAASRSASRALAAELARRLREMAEWLGLSDVEVGEGDDLCTVVRTELRAHRA